MATATQETGDSPVVETSFPYVGEVEICFPTRQLAEYASQVLAVDAELGDRVRRTMEILEDTTILKIRFEAIEAKMLRVSMSSFYDSLQVVLKCLQEFE